MERIRGRRTARAGGAGEGFRAAGSVRARVHGGAGETSGDRCGIDRGCIALARAVLRAQWASLLDRIFLAAAIFAIFYDGATACARVVVLRACAAGGVVPMDPSNCAAGAPVDLFRYTHAVAGLVATLRDPVFLGFAEKAGGLSAAFDARSPPASGRWARSGNRKIEDRAVATLGEHRVTDCVADGRPRSAPGDDFRGRGGARPTPR